MTSAQSLVRFEAVRKTYDGTSLVVRDLDLEIARGEFLTLLGPSGSGKTTTLMMLAGFESPTEGTITFEGRPLNHVPPWKRDIGMVFQNYALFPHMTVAENVAFPLTVRRVPRHEIGTRVARALDMVRLPGFEGRRPTQLSGGQQQRVALARALVFEPPLILMDEPLGALDKQLREHMQIEIKHLHEALGVTVVYVTHDQTEALTMSDRVAVFHDGVVQQLAAPRTLYEEPCNSFVAGFIGENNRLPGTVESVADGYCRVRLDLGATIHARAANVAGAPSRTSVSIRPERAAIGGAGADNRLETRFSEMIYLGDHARLSLRLADGSEFVVKLPIGQLPGGIDPGDAVGVSFRADDARALDPAE